MTHQIKIIPSNHHFEADENETLLDAALRAGLNMTYSCASGGCGECKARIISGDWEVNRFFDFRLSEAEKLQNFILLCCTRAKSDLVIEAQEARSVADIPMQNIAARIAKKEKAGDEHIVLHIRTPRSRTLRFLAGQYVTLTVNGMPPRDMALASCPCNGMVLQFHMRKNETDPFSIHVFNNLSVGDKVLVEGPFGDFTLDEESKRPIVMVVQDTGFAPMKSLIEHAIALDLQQSMYLFWVASGDNSHYLSNYCRAWEDALDGFVFIALLLDPKQDKTTAYASVTKEIMARSPVESEIDLYVAAPTDLAILVAQAFGEHGTPASRIAVTGTC